MCAGLGLQSVMICCKLEMKSVIVKRMQRGVLRGVSAWADATSRTGKGAERGLASVSTQDLFPLPQFIIVCGCSLAPGIGVLLNLGFDHSDKFTGAHVQCIGNLPKSFKICLLGSVLDHRQMCAGNSRKTAQNILRYTFLIAEIAYCFPYRMIVELHRFTPLSQQLVYEKTRK